MSSFLCGILYATLCVIRLQYLCIFFLSCRKNARMTLVIYRKGHTRSHSEHGSQAFLSRWYSARGRVGCRQRHARVFAYMVSLSYG